MWFESNMFMSKQKLQTFILSVAIPILAAHAMMIDWKSFRPGTRFVPPPAKLITDDKARDFLLREYENAVKEIQSRLEQENLLFAVKFTFVGSLIAVFFYRYRENKSESQKDVFVLLRESTLAAFLFWAAVITCGVIDCRIFFHVDIINTLGEWIRYHVEPATLTPQGITGWEHFVPRSNFFTSRLYGLLRLSVHLLTVILFVASILVFPEVKRGSTLATVNVVGSCGALIVIALAALHYRYADTAWLLTCGIALAAGIISRTCAYWLTR
jgi:hypothetical protein